MCQRDAEIPPKRMKADTQFLNNQSRLDAPTRTRREHQCFRTQFTNGNAK